MSNAPVIVSGPAAEPKKIPQHDTADPSATAAASRYLWLRVIVSILGLLYLLAAATNQLPARLDTPELVLVIVLIIWNSGLLEKLAKLSINKDGISLETQVEKQNAAIMIHANELATQNVELRTQQVELKTQQQKLKAQHDSLREQQKALEELQAVQRDVLAFIAHSFLVTGELEKLEKLHTANGKNEGFSFNFREQMVPELERLGGLDFVTNVEGSGIHRLKEMKDGEPGDLTKFFRITNKGREYLDKRNSLRLSERRMGQEQHAQ